MFRTWTHRCWAVALWTVPVAGLALSPVRAPAEMLVERFALPGATAINHQAYSAAARVQESATSEPNYDYLGSLGLALTIQFFPPHYGNPPPHSTPPPIHHDPPPVNPPPTDSAPEPATLLSGALGMGILSLDAAARRKKNKS